jgi:type II secretory pathway pseudopilin PulG
VEVLLVLVVVAVAVLVIGAPLRSGRRAEREAAGAAERAELEAARDAKYAEIRDAEIDYRTGKLSESDWRALDRQLRREAVELLHRLDELP